MRNILGHFERVTNVQFDCDFCCWLQWMAILIDSMHSAHYTKDCCDIFMVFRVFFTTEWERERDRGTNPPQTNYLLHILCTYSVDTKLFVVCFDKYFWIAKLRLFAVGERHFVANSIMNLAMVKIQLNQNIVKVYDYPFQFCLFSSRTIVYSQIECVKKWNENESMWKYRELVWRFALSNRMQSTINQIF